MFTMRRKFPIFVRGVVQYTMYVPNVVDGPNKRLLYAIHKVFYKGNMHKSESEREKEIYISWSKKKSL
jgi:hypothetical protein